MPREQLFATFYIVYLAPHAGGKWALFLKDRQLNQIT
jgi:hypothetical protein